MFGHPRDSFMEGLETEESFREKLSETEIERLVDLLIEEARDVVSYLADVVFADEETAKAAAAKEIWRKTKFSLKRTHYYSSPQILMRRDLADESGIFPEVSEAVRKIYDYEPDSSRDDRGLKKKIKT
jgi:hypothetical protein